MQIRPIKTENDYETALARIDVLMDAELGTNEGDELDVLTTLVEVYEDKHFSIEMPDPIAAIKFKMEQSGFGQNDLSRVFNSPSRASEILNRRRHLTVGMIRRLNEEWRIPAECLIKPYEILKP
ncbi:MAG: transcriptional regulator [Proteobacteria bacterium]|nr:transcriptional regulator [Pseudomonadota bacterium]